MQMLLYTYIKVYTNIHIPDMYTYLYIYIYINIQLYNSVKRIFLYTMCVTTQMLLYTCIKFHICVV